MQKYKVVFTVAAERDLDDIVVYLSNFAVATALKYYDEITQAAESLQTMPERCPYVNDKILREKGYRWLGVQNYMIFYVVNNATRKVQVRRILYSSRDYTALL